MYNPTKPYKKEILRTIETTWHSPYVSVTAGLYPTFRKHFSFPEVQHTDGIGTKGNYHWSARTFRAAVIDALAMNLNDLAMVRATPYALQNHLVLPKDDTRAIRAVITTLADICRRKKIAMTGGETSIHDDVRGLDISITVSGFIPKQVPNVFRAGDILIGLKSSGIHSNGFSVVRRVFGNKVRKEFTIPTAIYLDTILALTKKYTVHGMMHITGGAFSKLKDVLGNNDALIEQPQKLFPQEIFFELFTKGLSNKEMYATFNCGVGFILSAPFADAQKIIAHTKNAALIGRVVKGKGRVIITSAFDGKRVVL